MRPLTKKCNRRTIEHETMIQTPGDIHRIEHVVAEARSHDVTAKSCMTLFFIHSFMYTFMKLIFYSFLDTHQESPLDDPIIPENGIENSRESAGEDSIFYDLILFGGH